MTLSEVISIIDTQKPNTYTDIEKIRWLSELDTTIKHEIIDTHESNEPTTFDGYDENTPNNTELLIGKPYDSVYIHWLESKIDYTNQEYAKYNNTISLFNTAYLSLARAYNREYMPKGTKFKYF